MSVNQPTETVQIQNEITVDPVETIPIPTDRARRGLPVRVEVSNIRAWPGQRLRIEMHWNAFRDRWSFDAYHVNVDDMHLFSGTATLWNQYDFWPYCLLVFQTVDPTVEHITRETLPDVYLAIYPGPEGGDFLPEAEISDEEAIELFRLETGERDNPPAEYEHDPDDWIIPDEPDSV